MIDRLWAHDVECEAERETNVSCLACEEVVDVHKQIVTSRAKMSVQMFIPKCLKHNQVEVEVVNLEDQEVVDVQVQLEATEEETRR